MNKKAINYNSATRLTGGFCDNCGSRVQFSNEYRNPSIRCSKCILKSYELRYKGFTSQY